MKDGLVLVEDTKRCLKCGKTLKINKFYNVSKFYALWIKLLTYPPLIHHKNNVSTICGYQNFNRWITIKKPLFIKIFCIVSLKTVFSLTADNLLINTCSVKEIFSCKVFSSNSLGRIILSNHSNLEPTSKYPFTIHCIESSANAYAFHA